MVDRLERQLCSWIAVNSSGASPVCVAGSNARPWNCVSFGAQLSLKSYLTALRPGKSVLGKSLNRGFGATLQPNQHFSQSIDINTVRFNQTSGDRVFAVDIVNTRTTYPFSKHFLVRLLEQFDSSSHRLLTDLLASYEFVPGTVFHAGYGSLYEKQTILPGRLVLNNFGGNYMTVSRGLFFKASYLHRF
jgi:hypothetical protein